MKKLSWPKKVWRGLMYTRYAPTFIFRRDAYSTEGEDLIIRRVFGKNLRDGFYVDVGAYHPKQRSNTYLFYRMGWRGINVEAFPGRIALFNQSRPRDINIEAAVSDEPADLTFYKFDIAAMNTLSKERADEVLASNRTLLGTVSVPCRRLDDILDSHSGQFDTIHFMSIDVEGLELPVLRSNDWMKYRPLYLLIETLDWALGQSEKTDVVKFIEDQGYSLFARTVHTSIFKRADINV